MSVGEKLLLSFYLSLLGALLGLGCCFLTGLFYVSFTLIGFFWVLSVGVAFTVGGKVGERFAQKVAAARGAGRWTVDRESGARSFVWGPESKP